MVVVGRFDREVTFQSKSESGNDYNEEVPTFTDAFTTFAQVIELPGDEVYEGQQKQSNSDIKLKIRFREDVTLEHRFVYDDKTYDITSIQRMGKRGRDSLIILGKIRIIPE